MNKKYTGKQVIKAGEFLEGDIINSADEFDRAMDILSYWRFSHEVPLGEALEILREITLKIDKTAIFAKRLKRYVSIVLKLKRFKQMKLKNMQDIGGCRAIVSTPKKLYKVARELKRRPEFKNSQGKIRYKDYIVNPKEDGYRGYHIVGQFKDEHGDKKDIEVQLRTNIQHDWATALEIVDLFTGQALKSNRGDENWKRFFSSVSAQFAVMESIHLFNALEDKEKYKLYVKQLNANPEAIESFDATREYSEKLGVVEVFEAFTHSLKIVDGHLEKNSEAGYVLVEVDTTKQEVKTIFFKDSANKNAEKMYIDAEKRATEKNGIVVALVSTTAVGGIKEAYPNYFADSTDFLKYLLFITNASAPKNKRNTFSDESDNKKHTTEY
ncbi:RelA/SpoT domain-containing protein [Methylobacter luteus]|uniref:RelA/SpoT domain-containing protein n=1 Tax=Methylobacter luteus TaxID=415 RepID=UPI0004009551|nr:RelA/SpoT domain-containing protein [Methylobacter luteus]